MICRFFESFNQIEFNNPTVAPHCIRGVGRVEFRLRGTAKSSSRPRLTCQGPPRIALGPGALGCPSLPIEENIVIRNLVHRQMIALGIVGAGLMMAGCTEEKPAAPATPPAAAPAEKEKSEAPAPAAAQAK